MSLPTWLEIDLAALDHNLELFNKALTPRSKFCAVVKADAYGLGAERLVKHLYQRGVRWFALYNLEQVQSILEFAPEAEFLVLMPTEVMAISNRLRRVAKRGRLHLTIHSKPQLKMIRKLATTVGATIPVHLEIDTGMSRNGAAISQVDEMLAEILEADELELTGVFSHPSCADVDPGRTQEQYEALCEVLRPWQHKMPENMTLHFANTHAALRGGVYQMSMARIGLGLFGYGGESMKPEYKASGITGAGSVETIKPAVDADQLKPVLRWMSRLVHVAEYPAGATVGYGASYTTTCKSRIGIVPVGYADGYPLALSNCGIMRLGPQLKEAPVRGRVNMDQIMIDLTNIPEADLYDTVEIYAAAPSSPNALPKLASLAKVNCYEMLCRLSPRLDRRYLNAPRFYDAQGFNVSRQGGVGNPTIEPVIKAGLDDLAPRRSEV